MTSNSLLIFVTEGASPASHVTHYELEDTNVSEDFSDFKSI